MNTKILTITSCLFLSVTAFSATGEEAADSVPKAKAKVVSIMTKIQDLDGKVTGGKGGMNTTVDQVVAFLDLGKGKPKDLKTELTEARAAMQQQGGRAITTLADCLKAMEEQKARIAELVAQDDAVKALLGLAAKDNTLTKLGSLNRALGSEKTVTGNINALKEMVGGTGTQSVQRRLEAVSKSLA